jgi:hypothetical protein
MAPIAAPFIVVQNEKQKVVSFAFVFIEVMVVFIERESPFLVPELS